MRIFFLFLCLITNYCFAQNNYPQDYFRNPLDIPLLLSGTFGELRSNHFHSGLDIKTQQRRGLKVYAVANGFVSRIKISHYGYGKALYITHPNGYTSVYAHLQKFSPEIEAFIKAHQYEKETFEIELFPGALELLVKKNDIVAYSGNTGGSGGPHLHFELRDEMERPLNPMLFGIKVKDTREPEVASIYVYPLDKNSHVNNTNEKQKLRLVALQNGDYTVENIIAFGKLGFGISTIDRQDLTSNKNGVYHIKTVYNGNTNFELDFKRFSFDETRHLNRLIDFEHYKTLKQRIQKLFVESNNPLSIYSNVEDNGIITVEDSTSNVYKIRVTDFENNEAWVNIPIKGVLSNDIKQKESVKTPDFIYADQSKEIVRNNITVSFPRQTFYDDFYLDFDVQNDTIRLHKDIIPIKKHFTISYDVSNYSENDKNQLYIAELVGYNDYPLYSSTKRKGNVISTKTRSLGKYALVRDTISPTIKPINFEDGKWLSKYRYLKVKIEDKESRISNYRATVNGKWILMEYDYKTKTLVHDFNDNKVTDTKNNLKIIVTDNVGNNSTFEAIFYRK